MKLKNRLTKEEFESEFLKGEWYKSQYDPVRNQYSPTIDNPDLQNPKHNQVINQLLWAFRKPLLEKIPTNIEWWEADLEDKDFENALIIRETDWENTFGNLKRIKDVSKAISEGIEDKGVGFTMIREIQKNIGTHPFSERIIMISESGSSTPSIIEGNHRVLAFQLELIENGTSLHIPKTAIIGTSPNIRICPWWNWL